MCTEETESIAGLIMTWDISFVYEGLMSDSVISKSLLHFDYIAICSLKCRLDMTMGMLVGVFG